MAGLAVVVMVTVATLGETEDGKNAQTMDTGMGELVRFAPK